MARLRLLEGRLTDALELGKQAAELAPNDTESHVILAKVYAALGRAAEATREWERAAALGRTDPMPYYHLYRTYSALGDREKAAQALRKYEMLVKIYGTR
jgi:tetratricopeptide (TPR) repeat protein